MTALSEEPYDRWHKKHPKPGAQPCRCGSKAHPSYPSSEHGRGKRWQARYIDPSGQMQRPAFVHYDEAVQCLAEARTDMSRGTWSDPSLGRGPAVDYVREWLTWIGERYENENTVSTYTTHANEHIIPFLAGRVARELRRADSNALVDALIAKTYKQKGKTKKLSATYIGQVFKTWRIWVNWLVDEKELPLPANITKRVKLPKAQKREAVELTPAEVARLAECIEPRFEVLVWMAACGGLREGEAFGMTRRRVDFLGRRWHVKEQRQRGKARKTKTEASEAWVSVDAFLIEQISAHLAAGYDKPAPVHPKTEQRRTHRQARGEWSPPVDEGLLVTNHAGRPLSRKTFFDYWKTAVEKAGVDPETHFHDLKHFYTRTLATSGDHDPKTVQRLSRHARFEETWETYAGSGAGAETVKVVAFSAAFAPSEEDGQAAAG